MARGEIFFVDLPHQSTGAREQSGRRPVIVVQTDATSARLPTLMVVPLATNLRRLRFPHTIRVDPSPENGLTQPSVLLVFQLRSMDKNRILRSIGILEDTYLDQLDDELRRLLNL